MKWRPPSGRHFLFGLVPCVLGIVGGILFRLQPAEVVVFRRSTHTLVALGFIVTMLLVGCDSQAPATHVEAEALVFESAKAPYAVELSSNWKREDPAALNSHADFAASYRGAVYVIVIAQELPQMPNVEPPDALALKRASLEVMKTQVEELTIERQGPVRIGTSLGQTVLSSGKFEKERVKYVTTYVTRENWGIQLVAWGPADSESLVVSQADEFLAGWRFNDKNPKAPAPIKSPPTNP